MDGLGHSGRILFHDHHPQPADMLAEVLSGLSEISKRIPPKFFYDQHGSRLFDAITELPEYYPTRTEIGILRDHGEEMAARIGRDALLVELGSGSSLKIRVLLEALSPSVYMPVDISKAHLLESAERLAWVFPDLEIQAVCADYTSPFVLPIEDASLDCTAFFPGSSIGNFQPGEAKAFLRRIGQVIGPGGQLLIGVDLLKDVGILETAYNDAQGVTAEFNLNLLRRLNRELNADFDLDAFRHQAFLNSERGRIEMHLISVRDQRVRIADRVFSFDPGESIHTECSYKYGIDEFQSLAAEAGYLAEHVWTDEDGLFSVHCLRNSARPTMRSSQR